MYNKGGSCLFVLLTMIPVSLNRIEISTNSITRLSFITPSLSTFPYLAHSSDLGNFYSCIKHKKWTFSDHILLLLSKYMICKGNYFRGLQIILKTQTLFP